MENTSTTHRKRNVIVRVGDGVGGYITPLDVDLDSWKNQEEIMVKNRRTMTRFMNSCDREFYGSIRKEDAGHRVRYFTSVLTDMWLWARVAKSI